MGRAHRSRPHRLGKKLQLIRVRLGLTQSELIKRLAVKGEVLYPSSISLFEPGNSITSALANEFAEAAPGLHQASLMYLGLILFVITSIVLALSKLMLMKLAKNEGTRT